MLPDRESGPQLYMREKEIKKEGSWATGSTPASDAGEALDTLGLLCGKNLAIIYARYGTIE